MPANSNFAVIMDMLHLPPEALRVAVSADYSLVSRWRNGGRKLVAGRHWAQDLSAFFLAHDAMHENLIPRFLTAFYPAEDADEPGALHALMERFLTDRGQFNAVYQQRRAQVLRRVVQAPPSAAPALEGEGLHITALGEAEVHRAILDMLDALIDMGEAFEGDFVCPEGLALLTEDEAFARPFMQRLMKLYGQGFRQRVVLRTDFKLSEVSFFSGPWLVAHLLGYVKSHYYDDFRKLEGIRMMAYFGDMVAGWVYPDAAHGVRGEFYFDREKTVALREEMAQYFVASTQRFRYGFFPDPGDFLLEGKTRVTGNVYLFSRLPHFGITGERLLEHFNMSQEEKERATAQFWPFFLTPRDMPERQVFHIFCTEEIERALEKPRHRITELSDLCGRRIHMSTGAFVELLMEVGALLEACPNYHACFLPERYFEEMVMQIGAWGNEAAIGWLPGGNSTACRDFYNVGALHGFCATIWNRIPGVVKMQGSVIAKINAWVKRARRKGW